MVDGAGGVGYSRELSVAGPEHIRRHNPDARAAWDHDGIEAAFIEKGSSIWYWSGERWAELNGSDQPNAAPCGRAAVHACGGSQLIAQGTPKRSTSVPNATAQNVASSGWMTRPRSARASKTPRAVSMSGGLVVSEKPRPGS